MATATAPASRLRPARRRSSGARRRETLAALGFLSPWIIGFVVFTGLFFGAASGAAYLLLRRWLPGGRAGGVAFGALLLVLMWTAVLPPENNLFMDDHLIYALILIALALTNTTHILGLGKIWERLPLVQNYTILP